MEQITSRQNPLIARLRKLGGDRSLRRREGVFLCEGVKLAEEAGSQKAVNVVLIGAMARRLGGEKESWLSAVERCVPPKFLEMNKKAFELGWNA